MGWKDEKGGAAVEFAVVLPLLLMVVFGIVEFGLLLYNQAMITNASREAARSGIVYITDATSGDLARLGSSDLGDIVNHYCRDYLITFNPTPPDPETLPTTDPPGQDLRSLPSGDRLTVTVRYHYDFLLMPAFLSDLVGGIDLVAQTTMRAE